MATELETDDNIAMLWVPDEVPEGGLALSYRLYFGPGVPHPASPGRVVSTRFARVGDGARPLRRRLRGRRTGAERA